MNVTRPAAVILLALGSLEGPAIASGQTRSDATQDLATMLIAAPSADARRVLLDEYADAITLELQQTLAVKAGEFRRASKAEDATRAYYATHDVAERRGDRAAAAMALVTYSAIPGLPQAEQQAVALTALYGASQSRSFVGAAATEGRIRSAAQDATILQFTTHAVFDDTNPMYSFCN